MREKKLLTSVFTAFARHFLWMIRKEVSFADFVARKNCTVLESVSVAQTCSNRSKNKKIHNSHV